MRQVTLRDLPAARFTPFTTVATQPAVRSADLSVGISDDDSEMPGAPQGAAPATPKPPAAGVDDDAATVPGSPRAVAASPRAPADPSNVDLDLPRAPTDPSKVDLEGDLARILDAAQVRGEVPPGDAEDLGAAADT
eukprot:9466602-Pyramimonas_sp.AAC.1